MKNKFLLITIAILMIILIGCGATAKANGIVSESALELEFIGITQNVYEYRDSETGVHYLVLNHKSGYGGMGGICPRYNADGTLYVD